MDFYIVLGVERAATASDIKRAYRRLARRLHPDINPGDREAATQFQQVLDAYETLIDPDRRRRYDSGAQVSAPDDSTFGFTGFDFSVTPDARRAPTFGELFEDVLTRRAERQSASAVGERGADLHATASLSFEEAWRGVDWPVTLTRHEPCQSCAGSGFHRTAESRCLACDGSGAVRSVRGHMVFTRACPHCGGGGRLKQQACGTCRGQGIEARAQTLSVRLPAGITDGTQVRLAGKGHAAPRGGGAGDLYVRIAVRPHPVYTRVGDDVLMTVALAVHEAALGARVEIESPDGPVTLRVPGNTQSGQRFRLHERGAPTPRGTRGDLIVDVRVMLPRRLDERSKALLREFGERNPQSGRELLRDAPTVDDGRAADLAADDGVRR